MVYAVVPLPTGALGLVDALVIVGGIAGFTVAIIAAAMRERRISITCSAVDAEGAHIEHIVAIVLWAVAFFALVYARLGAIPGEFESACAAALARTAPDHDKGALNGPRPAGRARVAQTPR